MEAILSFETLVHIKSTRRHIPEDGILHSHRRENLKSYNILNNFLGGLHLTVLFQINGLHLFAYKQPNIVGFVRLGHIVQNVSFDVS
jgi:hypothetical protein